MLNRDDFNFRYCFDTSLTQAHLLSCSRIHLSCETEGTEENDGNPNRIAYDPVEIQRGTSRL